MLSRIMHFIRTEIWRIRLKDHSRSKSFLIRQLRVLALTVRGYQEDSCKFRASALMVRGRSNEPLTRAEAIEAMAA